MCRSAQRRGRAHRAHPRNHGDAEHPAEQDGGGHLRTADTPVGGMRPRGKDAVPPPLPVEYPAGTMATTAEGNQKGRVDKACALPVLLRRRRWCLKHVLLFSCGEAQVVQMNYAYLSVHKDRLSDYLQSNTSLKQTNPIYRAPLPLEHPNLTFLQHHLAFPRNYNFILDDTDVCRSNTPFLVLVVPVAPGNRKARDAIRKTWGTETLVQGELIQTVFLLGLPSRGNITELQEHVSMENLQYHDLIQSDFIDSYNNLTIKTMVIMDWLATQCPRVSYAMKIDSDMFLNVENLVSMLKSPGIPKELYLTGMLARNAPVIRDRSSKWYVPMEMYPDPHYPTYTLGMGYLFSIDLTSRFVEVSKSIEPINIEDAYIGMCMKKLGLSPTQPPDPNQFRAYLALLPFFVAFSLNDREGQKSDTLSDPERYYVPYPRDYKFILDDAHVCDKGAASPFLVLVVPVAPGNRLARDIIRQTWGKQSVVQVALAQPAAMLMTCVNKLTEMMHNCYAYLSVHKDRLSDYLQSNTSLKQTNPIYRAPLPLEHPNLTFLQHHLAFPRNYNFILDDTDVCRSNTPFLVLVVPVAPGNRKARDAIRKTWGTETLVQGELIQTVFLLGLPSRGNITELQEHVSMENLQYHDLIQSDFIDSYNNLTIKTMVIMDWLATQCPRVSYAMKIDSDMFLNVENLVSMLKSPGIPKELYLTGMLARNAPVIRDRSSKWYVPMEMYPDPHYPTYTLGMGYLFSIDLTSRFVEVSKSIEPINIEDAYIGMCMKKLGLSPTQPPDPNQFRAYLGKYNRCTFSKIITYILGSSEQLVTFWTDLKMPGPPC
ncbi:unnamed protein product [Boreogadus saida]